ncbi:MAG: iron chelate uptake ABC transporter family permease subunit [Paraglaciecola sp.]|nr:iron chelate uptake ABC transporter family permease subunit [Paraglaciecola sp.]MDP5129547.1 iron chelate uptake ABC transporter family permease subunit [Paraglaciecola sp.]
MCSVLLVLFDGLSAPWQNELDQQIIIKLRLPLVITACLVGAALSISSASLQVLLHNPLADPGIIGITSGASLCAALFLLLGGGLAPNILQYLLPLSCFIGAIISTILIFSVARRLAANHASVILAGIAISTISGAVVAWLHFFSDAQSMRNLTFWLMGSLHQADWPILFFAAPLLGGLIAYLMKQGRALNWYYFGQNSAQLAGLDVHKFQNKMLLVCALSVGAAVSLAGSIAFVGLLVPHLLRNFFGYDNRFILPASAILGACLLLWVELATRWFMGISLPVSMITASLGGPIFLYSVARLGKKRH